jgi:hypothetical protein
MEEKGKKNSAHGNSIVLIGGKKYKNSPEHLSA